MEQKKRVGRPPMSERRKTYTLRMPEELATRIEQARGMIGVQQFIRNVLVANIK